MCRYDACVHRLGLNGCVNVRRCCVCVCVDVFFFASVLMHGLLLVKETRSAESGPMAQQSLKREPLSLSLSLTPSPFS